MLTIINVRMVFQNSYGMTNLTNAYLIITNVFIYPKIHKKNLPLLKTLLNAMKKK